MFIGPTERDGFTSSNFFVITSKIVTPSSQYHRFYKFFFSYFACYLCAKHSSKTEFLKHCTQSTNNYFMYIKYCWKYWYIKNEISVKDTDSINTNSNSTLNIKKLYSSL